jgi:hypothetical protein
MPGSFREAHLPLLGLALVSEYEPMRRADSNRMA